MTYEAAVDVAMAMIDNVPENGLANGDAYVNTARHSSSHIKACLRWPWNADGTARGFVDQVARYSRADLDANGRTATADKVDFAAAVAVAIGRASASRFYGWSSDALNPAETLTIPNNTPDLVVHGDHEEAIAEAITDLALVAPRLMGVFFYNSISYETVNHHHLPEVTKKLAATTIGLTGLEEWLSAGEGRESAVFHDMFHPVTDVRKSNAARAIDCVEPLYNMGFPNLAKRIPVKAPDSGVAINYSVLLDTAMAFRHTPAHLPAALNTPRALREAINAYVLAQDAAELTQAVNNLRVLSGLLAEPSAFLVGFIVGRMGEVANDFDLNLRMAKRESTILGSPAYTRVTSEYAGTYNRGLELGHMTVAATEADQVMPRVLAGVAAVTAFGVADVPVNDDDAPLADAVPVADAAALDPGPDADAANAEAADDGDY